ncbi:MAG: tetratricopeptide repeat-containing sensor histidine kinase [Flavobacterium psychrophilum]
MKLIKCLILGAFWFTVFSCSKFEKTGAEFFSFSNEKYKELNPKKKKLYLDSLYSNRSKTANDSLFRNFLFDLSAEYFYLNEYKNSLKISREISQLSTQDKDFNSLGRSYYYAGDCYLITNKDSAYYYYYQAEKLYQKLKVKEKQALILFKKALLLIQEGNYIESEIQVSKSLLLLKGTTNYELLFSAYSILGSDFEKLEEYDNALKYYLLADDILKLMKKNDPDFDSRFNYNLTASINLSFIYEKLGNHKKANEQLASLVTDDVKEKWPKEYAVILNNLGNIKMISGDLAGAYPLFINALKISKQFHFEDNLVYEYINLGEYFYKSKDFTKSKFYLKEALKLGLKINATDEIKTTLKFLVKVDAFDRFHYYEMYIRVTDSLAKAQRISRNKYARIEFETEAVEEENKVLSTKITYILFGSLLIIFALVLVLIYRYIQNQKREIEFRIAQQKAEEEIFELLKEYQLKLSITKELEQNRISKELHDGVMNRLYGARMQLGIWNESDTKEAKEKRLIYVDLLQEIELEIRSISHDLRSEIVDNQLDFMSLLYNMIQLQNEIGETAFVFETPNEIDWDTIDSVLKINLFRIVQECLLNATKHANARECKVTITIVENNLILQIQDDGIGFDILATKPGIGLTNMQERAKTIKAQLTIRSTPSVGTVVLMKVKIGSL